jgi:hypothetical protein
LSGREDGGARAARAAKRRAVIPGAKVRRAKARRETKRRETKRKKHPRSLCRSCCVWRTGSRGRQCLQRAQARGSSVLQ